MRDQDTGRFRQAKLFCQLWGDLFHFHAKSLFCAAFFNALFFLLQLSYLDLKDLFLALPNDHDGYCCAYGRGGYDIGQIFHFIDFFAIKEDDNVSAFDSGLFSGSPRCDVRYQGPICVLQVEFGLQIGGNFLDHNT